MANANMYATTLKESDVKQAASMLRGRGSRRTVSAGDLTQLHNGAVATQTNQKNQKAEELLATWGKAHDHLHHTKVSSKKVLVPVDHEVIVPVVRKEARREKVEKTVTGNKLVPVTRYKPVTETFLKVEEKMIDGRAEKRYIPVTRTKQIPYTDFESRPVEVTVTVPKEDVVTRKGFRTDIHTVSHVCDIDEEHHFKMQPVYMGKGDTRMEETGDHHTYKYHHGTPNWDKDVVHGWTGKPNSPRVDTGVPRPDSARSLRSMMSQRMGTARSLGGMSNGLTRSVGSLI